MSWRVSILVYLMVIFTCAIVVGTDIERRLTTVYDIDGRPIDQSQENPGLHWVRGSVTLTDGADTVTLNTSTELGRDKISFLSAHSYSGSVWSLDTSNTNRYWIIPLSGIRFVVKSDDGADTSTVYFSVGGQ